MIAILADHNIEGQAELLWGTLVTEGWLELCPVELVLFADIGLSPESSDRAVWRLAQERRMILLTDNRSQRGEDSLEQTIREEASRPDRFAENAGYARLGRTRVHTTPKNDW